MINILFFGDVSGDVGVKGLIDYIPFLKKKFAVDLVIANCENATRHFGLSKKDFKNLTENGVDIITMGNHTFDNRGIYEILGEKKLVIPANWSNNTNGKGFVIVECKGIKIGIANLLGRIFMPQLVENPYITFENIYQNNKPDIWFVDYHAESNAEKYAFAHEYDGKISALVGTHTHIQSVDNRILPNGTGYISDVGMNGPYYSIIGVEYPESIYVNKTSMRTKFIPAGGPPQVCAVVLSINPETKKCEWIKRIYICPDENHNGK